MSRIGIVVNPNAKKNRNDPQRAERMRRMLGDRGLVVETPSVEAIADAVRVFHEAGVRTWVADGGDGALHWLLNQAIDTLGEERALAGNTFVPTRGGTVDFVARAARIEGDPFAVLRRLIDAGTYGRPMSIFQMPTLRFSGTAKEEATTRSIDRVGFGFAIAGYGANFFEPFYRTGRFRGPVRIVAKVGEGLVAAASRAAFIGPLRRLKPARLQSAEHDFLRPLHGRVWVNDAPFCDAAGAPMRTFTALNCASVPLDLAGVFLVFPRAHEGAMHLHIGNVSAAEMARVLPVFARGGSTEGKLREAYDGPCTSLRIACDTPHTLTPVLDGELEHGVVEARVSRGPTVRIASP